MKKTKSEDEASIATLQASALVLEPESSTNRIPLLSVTDFPGSLLGPTTIISSGPV